MLAKVNNLKRIERHLLCVPHTFIFVPVCFRTPRSDASTRRFVPSSLRSFVRSFVRTFVVRSSFVRCFANLNFAKAGAWSHGRLGGRTTRSGRWNLIFLIKKVQGGKMIRKRPQNDPKTVRKDLKTFRKRSKKIWKRSETICKRSEMVRRPSSTLRTSALRRLEAEIQDSIYSDAPLTGTLTDGRGRTVEEC